MNRSFFTISALFLISFYNATFSMEQDSSKNITLYTLLTNKDLGLGKTITDRLSKEDLNDMRLVNKEFAIKEPHWQFMPDGVEKEYNKFIKKHGKISNLQKKMILYTLTDKNDINSVHWIVNNKRFSNKINLRNSIPLNGETITFNYDIYPSMLAIHNNNYELARLLIEKENYFEDKDWKSYCEEMTAPADIQHCLYPSHSHDFSFIPYIVTIWSDNSEKLKELYRQKTPTHIGEWFLINLSITNHSSYCFNLLSGSGNARKMILNNNTHLMKRALDNNAYAIVKTMIEDNLYKINGTIGNNKTILNYYCDDADNKETNKYIITLLRLLGAKTFNEL